MNRNLRAAATVLLLLLCVSHPLTSGAIIVVAAGEDLQAAIESAVAGDIITLEAGARYVGSFVLPKKDISEFITITSSRLSDLPPAGTRIKPADSIHMPKLVTISGAPALATARGAHHYRLVGLEIHPAENVYGFELLALGDSEAATSEEQAHDLEIDRLYIHGDHAKGTKRGISLNSASTTITNSYISDIKSTFQDSQAICGWNGPGPFTIVNNYLEASGENVMFGGAKPGTLDLIPSDILIRGNYFYKPLSWKKGDPSYAGTPWVVKNLFELKNAQRLLVEGNIFENSWSQGQNGFALVLTVRVEGGTKALVDNVVFRNNIVRHAASAVNILGQDDLSGNLGQTQNLTFSNNLFEDINGPKWLGAGYLFQILNGARNIKIEHNTGLQTYSLIAADLKPNSGLIYRNNITPLSGYAVFGSGILGGISTLDHYFPDWVFSKNVLPGFSGYPPHPGDNSYPKTLDDVGFIDWKGETTAWRRIVPSRPEGLTLIQGRIWTRSTWPRRALSPVLPPPQAIPPSSE